MPAFVDRALHPATGRFRWLIAAIFLSPVAGYVSTAIVAVTAVLEAFRFRLIIDTIRASCAARLTAAILVLFFLSILVSDLLNQQGARGWSDLKYLLPIVGPLLLIVRLSDMSITFDDIGRLALMAASATIIVVVTQHLFHGLVLNNAGWRSAALSGNPLFVSAMLVPLLFLSWLGIERRSRAGQGVTAIVFFGGIAATAIALGARASVVIILLMTPVLLVFVLGRWRLSWPARLLILAAAIAALCGIALLTSIANPDAALRFKTLAAALLDTNIASAADAATGGRMQNWQAAWRAVWEQPLTGYGFRTDAAVIARYLPKEAVLVTSHQQYLSFGITAGIFGVLAGVAYLALPILNALAAPAAERGSERFYAGLALAGPIMLNGLTDTIFDDVRIQGFYSVMIVVLLCARLGAQQTSMQTA